MLKTEMQAVNGCAWGPIIPFWTQPPSQEFHHCIRGDQPVDPITVPKLVRLVACKQSQARADVA